MGRTLRCITQCGEGMLEYIVIVALIAIAGIAAFQFFGQTIRSQRAGIAHEVAGKSAVTVTEAQARVDDALTEGKKKKSRDNYKSDNAR